MPDHVRSRFSWLMPLFVLIVCALIAPRAAAASTYRWQVDASGNWNDPANWELVEGAAGAGYPNLVGDVAVFDEPLTAPRTVTIPDTVTVAIGRLTVAISPNPGRLWIENAGSGLLVFDNLGEDAVIESTGEGDHVVVTTPIQLTADVTVNGRFAFGGGISEAGGARNVTILDGSVLYSTNSAANTYTGTTTVVTGGLSLSHTVAALRLVGPLIVGDGSGSPGSATVSSFGDCIDHTADVTVLADGLLAVTRNSALTSYSATVDELTVAGGRVQVTGMLTASTLFATTLNMEGGEVLLPASTNRLQLSGALNLTSTAAGPAVIRSAPTGIFQPGSVGLTAGNHDFTVADGPQAVDFETVLTRIAGNGLTKRGPGVMRIGGEAFLPGGTSVMAGELIVNADASSSAFTVAANARLSGSGTVGSVTVAADGTVAPGAAVGAMASGPITLTTGSHFAAEILSTSSYDRLNVTGTVTLGNATLDVVTSVFVFPPTATFTIIDNDGNDAVVGTFAGYPEGSLYWAAPGGPAFTVSYEGGDGNDVTLTNATAVEYFLSEGATGSFFDEDVLIANPNLVPAPVSMVFYLPGGGIKLHNLTVPAQSRRTVEVDQIEGLEQAATSVEVHSENRLTLAVERTMFWDSAHYGGHTANSVPRAERQWFFAEGAQNDFFNTYLLLANPDGATTAKVTFLRESEPTFVLDVPLASVSRTTISAGDHPELVGRSFGIAVDAPTRITAERAMYFATTPQRLWSGGHDNVGSDAASTTWFHPEGASGTFFTTFILMSNPQTEFAIVTMKFLLPGGNPVEITRTIPPQSRLTVNPGSEVDELQNASFSTVVTSNVPIVSERAMYWPSDDVPFGEGHASSGLTTTALEWTLAEGRVGGPFAYTTYILLANPQSTTASVTVTYLRENGPPVEKSYDVAPNTRFNIDVGSMVPELQNESFGALITVTNDVPIAVERSMYWNVEGRFWSGGTNAVGAVVPR